MDFGFSKRYLSLNFDLETFLCLMYQLEVSFENETEKKTLAKIFKGGLVLISDQLIF